MGEPRNTKAIKGGEFHLPESIIHRIQSLLTGKEAAQTTVLSKPWHNAWLSRPNLDFDEGDFPADRDSCDEENDSSDEESDSPDEESETCVDRGDSSFVKFMKFVEMTIRRYEQSNLKIESLRLSLTRLKSFSDIRSNLANDLIVRALKIGATHVIFQTENGFFALPPGVFESGNLVKLTASGCKIDLDMDQRVLCSKLESLKLIHVRIESKILYKIISSCPKIRKLKLNRVTDFRYSKGSIGFPELHELRCLVLCKVELDKVFLADLSSKFPSLVDLTLRDCSGVNQIRSRSLERLTIYVAKEDILKAKFDVPSIEKFKFVGSDFPSVSFKSTSREWESHVSIYDDNYLFSTKWFNGLKRILTQLRSSKIHLSLSLYSDKSFNYKPRDICGLPKLPQVENVIMYFCSLPSSSCYALFDGVFRLCRPKFITHELQPENTHNDFLCKRFLSELNIHPENTHNDLLCKTLVRGMKGEFSSPSSLMHGLHDLEEAKMELYDEDVAAWRPLPLESFSDSSIRTPKVKKNVRFQLKWKP